MNQSTEINALAEALAKAQGEMQNPEKDKVNNHFHNRYATLAAGLDAVRPVLAKHGLSVVQLTAIDGDAMFLTTRIMHASGQFIESEYPVCRIAAPQVMGSAMTYARRYSLFSMLGIAPDEDDDGNSANDAGAAGGKSGARAQAEAQKARERARAEAETYVERCITGLDDIGSVDHLNTWWKAEGKNRSVHFADKQDPLYVRLYESVQAHGEKLKAEDVPQKDAAE